MSGLQLTSFKLIHGVFIHKKPDRLWSIPEDSDIPKMALNPESPITFDFGPEFNSDNTSSLSNQLKLKKLDNFEF